MSQMLESLNGFVLGLVFPLDAMESAYRISKKRLALVGVRILVMEWYTVASLGTMTALMGLIGLRLAKDEWLLRRKRLMINKY